MQRGLDAEQLRIVFSENQLTGRSYNSVNEAFKTAKANAKKDDLIYVGGSTFVVAEII